MLSLFRTDKPRYFLIGKRDSKVTDSPLRPWMVRAIEGHTIRGLLTNVTNNMLTERTLDMIPAICHGTRLSSIQSILKEGLSPMGRTAVLFSIFPHWDERVGTGQRSGTDQWDTVVFLNKDLAIKGSRDVGLEPLPISIAGASGSLNVTSRVLPSYFERIVTKTRELGLPNSLPSSSLGGGLGSDETSSLVPGLPTASWMSTLGSEVAWTTAKGEKVARTTARVPPRGSVATAASSSAGPPPDPIAVPIAVPVPSPRTTTSLAYMGRYKPQTAQSVKKRPLKQSRQEG